MHTGKFRKETEGTVRYCKSHSQKARTDWAVGRGCSWVGRSRRWAGPGYPEGLWTVLWAMGGHWGNKGEGCLIRFAFQKPLSPCLWHPVRKGPYGQMLTSPKSETGADTGSFQPHLPLRMKTPLFLFCPRKTRDRSTRSIRFKSHGLTEDGLTSSCENVPEKQNTNNGFCELGSLIFDLKALMTLLPARSGIHW